MAVALPEGCAGLVVPRSGLAARYGISVVNGPGLIDPSYRGEIRVVLVNLGDEPYQGEPGDRDRAAARRAVRGARDAGGRRAAGVRRRARRRRLRLVGPLVGAVAVGVAVEALRHDRRQPRRDAHALGGVLALEVARDVVQLRQRLALGERHQQLDVEQ